MRRIFLLCLLLPTLAVAQVQLPSFLGTWCPQEGSEATYKVIDESHETDRLKVITSRIDPTAWRLRLVYSGLDTHAIEEVIGPRGLRGVSCAEPGLKLRPLSSFLWEGGGKPLEAAKVANLRGPENVTTDAGVFACQAYEGGEGKDRFQVWVCKDVSPYGLVLYKSGGTEMRLSAYKVADKEKASP